MRSTLMPKKSSLLGAALTLFLALSDVADACAGCSGGTGDMVMVRHVRRMQPDAKKSYSKPKGPLEWGQLNFLQTTDTHGWLTGHVKEENYGADWGDYVSFVKNMRDKAKKLCVDLLVVDTGDLHDGNGLADASAKVGMVNGEVSNKIFQRLDYDLMTIGNHELYEADVAQLTYDQFAKHYGDKYVTSNVEIWDAKKNDWQYIGAKYRKFKTAHGVNIMAFGVLFDFKGAANNTRVTKAVDMVKQPWFTDALKQKDVDMYVVFGHNPIKKEPANTMQFVYDAIRAQDKDTPISIFGGHTHVRDFVVYDEKAAGLESGRYCETLGWMSINNFKAKSGKQPKTPRGVPIARRPAINGTSSRTALQYSRRYMDWNRATFTYHTQPARLDTRLGQQVTNEIWKARHGLNLTQRYGCIPETYCLNCVPQDDKRSIFPVILDGMKTTVVNPERKDKPRIIISNTGGIRFDLIQGPFTYDDSFIVSPFTNTFKYIPDVPYDMAMKVLPILNTGPPKRKRSLPVDEEHDEYSHHRIDETSDLKAESCPDPLVKYSTAELKKRGLENVEPPREIRRIIKRQETTTAGYVTYDDFGAGGDDTPHSKIPYFKASNCIQTEVNMPASGKPEKVDVISIDFMAPEVMKALNANGGTYKQEDMVLYLPESFTSNTFLTEYVKQKWGSGTC